jgi:LmbE family N-acetylglucosaminyl deacetylase
MQLTILGVEIVGHLSLIFTFIFMLVYTFRGRKQITRYVPSSQILYWFILSLSGIFAVVGIIRLIFLLTHGVTAGMSPLMDLLAEYPSVVAQSIFIYYLITNKIVSIRATRPLRVLAIGAHPDDLEIAAGATLARVIDRGHELFGLIMTHGAQGGNAGVRPEEARAGGKFLGFSQLKIMDFKDTCLAEQTNEMVQAIEKLIREVEPDIILTHSIHDVHQDHQAVHEATLRAGRTQNTILCYESPSVTAEFLPTFYVGVSDYVQIKIESVRMHWDQRGKSYMKEEQIRGKLAFRGGQAKVGYAEGFEVVRMLSSGIGDF